MKLPSLSRLFAPSTNGAPKPKRILTLKEMGAQEVYIDSLSASAQKAHSPVIIAMVGLVGSGKSTVATELAPHMKAAIVSLDHARTFIRSKKDIYKKAAMIAENTVFALVKKRRSNVIFDADFADSTLRESLVLRAGEAGVRVVFLRVSTADPDFIIGRILTGTYRDPHAAFYGKALTHFPNPSDHSRAATVKMREMWRLTPRHYSWSQKKERWELKKSLGFKVHHELSTCDETVWKSRMRGLARSICS